MAPPHRRRHAHATAPDAPARRRYRHWSHNRVHRAGRPGRSEEHTSELQSLMRISYAVFCLKKQNTMQKNDQDAPELTDTVRTTTTTGRHHFEPRARPRTDP